MTYCFLYPIVYNLSHAHNVQNDVLCFKEKAHCWACTDDVLDMLEEKGIKNTRPNVVVSKKAFADVLFHSRPPAFDISEYIKAYTAFHWAAFMTRPRRPWVPAIVRPVVDATSWTFNSQLMKLISGSLSRVCLMVSVVSCIDGIVVLGWVVVLLLRLLRCCNNTR